MSSPAPRLYRSPVMADRWLSAGILLYAQCHECVVWVSWRVPYPHVNFVCGVTASSEAVNLGVVNVYFQKITRGAVRVVQVLGLGMQPACVGHVWHVVGRVDPWNDEKSLRAKSARPRVLALARRHQSVALRSLIRSAREVSCRLASLCSYSCRGRPAALRPTLSEWEKNRVDWCRWDSAHRPLVVNTG